MRRKGDLTFYHLRKFGSVSYWGEGLAGEVVILSECICQALPIYAFSAQCFGNVPLPLCFKLKDIELQEKEKVKENIIVLAPY